MQTPDIYAFTYKSGEETVLLHLLRNHEVDHIIGTCTEALFFDSFVRDVFRIAKEYILDKGQGEANFPAIRNIIQAAGTAEAAVQYLDNLYSKAAEDYPDLFYVIDRLKNLSTRRQLITALSETLAKAQNNNEDVDKLIQDSGDTLARIETGDKTRLEVVLPSQLLARRYAGLYERYHSKGIYTGWPGFDDLLSVGFAPGKTSVIAGRTSMGKSFFKTNMIINMCSSKVGVLNVCPEQGLDSEHDRIDSVMTGIYLKTIVQLRKLALGDNKFQMLKKNSIKIAQNWHYACVPSRNITVSGIRAAIRQVRRNKIPLDVVFVDLFDRLADVNVGKDRTANMTLKLGQIEQIAAEEKIHICLLVQVNRGPEGRKDKRPNLSDLRECGNFEQDADMVFLLYRENYYNRELEDNMLDVEIAKQRDGVAGVVYQFMMTDTQTLAIAPMGKKTAPVEVQGG